MIVLTVPRPLCFCFFLIVLTVTFFPFFQSMTHLQRQTPIAHTYTRRGRAGQSRATRLTRTTLSKEPAHGSPHAQAHPRLSDRRTARGAVCHHPGWEHCLKRDAFPPRPSVAEPGQRGARVPKRCSQVVACCLLAPEHSWTNSCTQILKAAKQAEQAAGRRQATPGGIRDRGTARRLPAAMGALLGGVSPAGFLIFPSLWLNRQPLAARD